MKLKHLRYFFMPQYATVAIMFGSFYDTYILMLDSKLLKVFTIKTGGSESFPFPFRPFWERKGSFPFPK